MNKYLETDRVILRDWTEADLEDFARINSDPLIMEFYPDRLDEKATKHLVKHFQSHIDKNGYGFFAVESKEDGRFMGFSGLAKVPTDMPFSPAVELAWRLDYDYWGKAYASEIAQALMTFGFETLKLKQIVAYCADEHDRAKHILEKMGFDPDKKGAFQYAPKRSKSKPQDYALFRMKAPK